MDTLPHSLLLQILSRLDDSADVARCRVASKSFNTVFPFLRSIDLRCSIKWYNTSRFSNSQPLNSVFFNLVSKLETVESVCIGFERQIVCENDDFNLTDGDFATEWLPRVSGSLKSLSLSGLPYYHSKRKSNILTLISAYCHHLDTLKLKFAWLSVNNLNPMPMLTTLTLAFIRLEDERLKKLNKCCPNLQVLNLVGVTGLTDPKIHLLNLKTCIWAAYTFLPNLTLIAPNLITLKIVCMIAMPSVLRIEAPMLSHFHLRVTGTNHVGGLILTKFEKLKTLWLECSHLASLFSKFPITKSVESLALDSRNKAPSDARNPTLSLKKVFTIFPNVSSLCIKSSAWLELEACLNPGGWKILDGRKGLKTICAYLTLVDPLLTFSSVACVLDQCAGLSDVSLILLGKDFGHVAESFMSKCMSRWPGLKWKWGLWSEHREDSWITDDVSIVTSQFV